MGQTIKSPKLVYNEIIAGGDELANWTTQRREMGLCVSPSKQVQTCFGQMSNLVASKYKPQNAAEFLKGGDGWVIAHALNATGDIVVTQENTRSYRAKIKVPTACKEFSVKVVDTFEMLEMLKAEF